MHRDRLAAVDVVEIHLCIKHILQRVEAQRVQLIGRKHPAEALGHQIGGRLVQTEAAQNPVQRAALHRREKRLGADRPPEGFERRARTLPPAAFNAIGQNHGIHRPGAGAADLGDGQPLILQQPVQHTPCQRAVRTTALKRQIDRLGSG